MSTSGFPLKLEPLRLQRAADSDPTPADYMNAPVPLPPFPFWQCTTLLDHEGCGRIWLRERRVACPCGGYVARVEADPGIDAWKKL